MVAVAARHSCTIPEAIRILPLDAKQHKNKQMDVIEAKLVTADSYQQSPSKVPKFICAVLLCAFKVNSITLKPFHLA